MAGRGGAGERDEPTFAGGVCLEELVPGAGVFELEAESRELGQLLVDEADFGGELLLVNVQGEEAADVS